MKPDVKKLFCSIFCCFALIFSQHAFCQIRLPRLISDGMVLQRDVEVKIWGWADAGETLTVHFNGQSHSTSANKDGQWQIMLSALKTGGPYEMDIHGNNRIVLKNILIGDVWVCSGQSNMVLPMDRVKYRYPEVIAESENTAIRQFLVPDRYDFKASREDLESGGWVPASPESVLNFTSVGYFFAKELFEKYHVPIGLINASLGGSPAEAWMSEDALKAFPAYLETAKKFKDDDYRDGIIEKDKAVSNAWYKLIDQKDKGLNGPKRWFDTSYDTSGWATMDVPGYWADQGLGHVNGAVWFFTLLKKWRLENFFTK